MSDLHARLLAQLGDRFDNYAVEVDRRGAALRAVVELHEPDRAWDCCNHEGSHVAYPCSTIQAIARELGVPEGDDDRG